MSKLVKILLKGQLIIRVIFLIIFIFLLVIFWKHFFDRQTSNTNKIEILEEHHDKHAAELQKDHMSKFEGKFVSFRTLLEVV